MQPITVTLMNTPGVKLGEAEICFPYRKAEGFFYYLCVKKSVTREEAASVFWAGTDEKSAKKNLRDVIYKIRRLLGEDALVVTGNSSVRLNPQRDIRIDLDQLSPDNIVDEYRGDFLGYFYIKNCLEFEKWCKDVRQYYRDMYTVAVRSRLAELVQSKDVNQIRKYSSVLIQNDIYNEELYRSLMRIYAESGSYNLAIKLYYELKEVLHEDLEEEPEAQTQKLFSEVLALKESHEREHDANAPYFYGRYEELYAVAEALKGFEQRDSRSLVISGEAGVGKSSLLARVRALAEERGFLVLTHDCQYAEKDFHLSVWYDFIEQLRQLADLGDNQLQQEVETVAAYAYSMSQATETTNRLRSELILETLMQLGRRRKLVFLLDDIQWMGQASRSLITNALFELGQDRAMMIATYRDDYEQQVSRFLVPLAMRSMVTRLELKRFTFDETRELVGQLLPEQSSDPTLAERVYANTEGNALFIVELAQIIKNKGSADQLSDKAANIIQSRLLDLAPEERDLLDAISLFDRRVNMSELKIFYPMVELEIFELLERLINKRLIKEESLQNDIYYSFTHQRLRDYAYQNQSQGKRQLLHRKIAAYYDSQLVATRDMGLYPKLIFHYKASGDSYQAARCRVDYAEKAYYVAHEIYPDLLSNYRRASLSYEGLDEHASLEQLALDIDRLDLNQAENQRLRMRIQFVLGRYYIHICQYPNALKAIDASLRIAKALQDSEYELKNYKQLVYYAIQVADMELMRKYLDLAQAVVKRTPGLSQEEYQMLRLEGLYALNQSDFPAARRILTSTIDLIEANDPAPGMNLAVCYNYLGNTYARTGDNETAFQQYNRAIEVSDEGFVTTGLGMFYSNAAQALLQLGRFVEARDYNARAIQCFEVTHTRWDRATAEMCAARIEAGTGHRELALEHAEQALDYARRLGNPDLLQQMQAACAQLQDGLAATLNETETAVHDPK